MELNSKLQVAIQGGVGSFHEISSIFHFGSDIENVAFDNFSKLIDAVETNELHAGLMAIENTVAGSLLPNYTLLKDKNIQIIGEILLRIEQNLMALPNQSIEDIHEVHSHPMALQQCAKFFKQYPHIKLIESDDTANSAKKIAQENLKNVAAIASIRAADLFGLNVLNRSIETNKRNFTRFLILTNNNQLKTEQTIQSNLNKASISFSLPHEQGSLSSILSMFAFYKVNLTKIQSIPLIGKEWEYHFIVDFTFGDRKVFGQSLDAIKPLISELQIYGIYEKAEKYYHSNELEKGNNLQIEVNSLLK
ncbi:MAG: prephenate dehydratase [Bacteroidetes bacterium]|nr:MAG: prephenate dehydratase [Bacteroidota bacterium]